MITVRKSKDRGHANHGCLDSYHSFSFADYYDPKHMGFRDLRVINEDHVLAAEGFGEHGHRDMEIITYPLAGELEHKDSMGTGSVLHHGDVQRMSAGRGVTHSEFNHSQQKGLHLLQIWIVPQQKGIKPSYEEKKFSIEEKTNQLRLVVSPDGRDGSLSMNQDAKLYASVLEAGKEVALNLDKGRHSWVQVAQGEIEVNGNVLFAGDGAAISEETALHFKASKSSEFLVFDLA